MASQNQVAHWYTQYTQQALTITQPRFWSIFWSSFCVSAAIGCTIYGYWPYQWSAVAKYLLLMGCLLFPLLRLRRLHLQAFVIFLFGLYGLFI